MIDLVRASDSNPSDHTAYRAYKDPLEIYAVLLRCAIQTGEKIAANQAQGGAAANDGAKKVRSRRAGSANLGRSVVIRTFVPTRARVQLIPRVEATDSPCCFSPGAPF